MRPLDRILIVSAALLVAVAPIMALQELAKFEDERSLRELTGHMPAPDSSYRSVWRLPLTGLVLVVGIAGTVKAILVTRDAGVRAVSGRLIALLLVGLATLDVAYYADGTYFLDAPYLLRASTVVWGYALAGILVGGSVHRLAEIESVFGAAAQRARERGNEFRL